MAAGQLSFAGVSTLLTIAALGWPWRAPIVLATSLVIAFYEPIFTSLWLGQVIFISLVVVAGASHAFQQQRWFALGLYLGLGLIKPQVTFLVVVALLLVALRERRWRVIAGFSLIFALFVLLSAPFAVTPRQILGGGIGEHLTLYLAHTGTLWGLSLQLLPGLYLLPALLCLALLAWLIWAWAQALRHGCLRQRLHYLLSAATIVNLLILPYSWSYNHVVLAFVLAYLVKLALQLPRRSQPLMLAGLAIATFILPVLVYRQLTVVYRSDVYQIIPVLAILPCLIVLQRSYDRLADQQERSA